MIRPLKWVLGLCAALVLVLLGSWFIYKPGPELRGHWETDGYGLHLDIKPTVIDLYQVTDVSCLKVDRLPAHLWLIAALEEVTLSASGDRLTISAGGLINPITGTRRAELPTQCDTLSTRPGTARESFDVFWQAMDEHYAFFDLHGVDWAARRMAHRPAADAILDDPALFDVVKQTMDGLDDGHLYIASPEMGAYSPEIRPGWYDVRHMVRDNTLAQFDELTAIDGTGILYAWTAEDIGYVYLTEMRVDRGLTLSTPDAASAAFEEIATIFADAKGIILDIRYNPGGSDDVSLAFASYFTDQEVPVLSKTTRTETGYTDPIYINLTPAGNIHLAQPTVVLTTGFTGSAAEIFTMAMRELPQVTVMGTATSGGLSDVLEFSLPNGWELGLSHQRYFAADGTLYEGTGVPADMVIPVDVDSAKIGIDTQLDAAKELLSQ